MDGALRSSLLVLGLVVVVVGAFTFSLKKMLVTYVVGIFGIAGLLLPDWEFFDRDFSQWFSPMPAQRSPPAAAAGARSFKFYPIRVAMITTIYCFGLYKWWKFVTS